MALANSTVAIGKPVARLFFDPQKTMVISSAREKPRRRLATVRSVMTMASSLHRRARAGASWAAST